MPVFAPPKSGKPTDETAQEKDAVAARKHVRDELARAFTGQIPAPSREKIREAFMDGLHVVHDLRQQNHLDEQDANRLIASLTSLYVQAELVRVGERFFGGPPIRSRSDALLFRWLHEAER